MASLVDIMTARGQIMAITRHGINRRDSSPIAQSSFEETVEILFRAATYGEVDRLRGVSENILLGQQCPLGTGACQLVLDEEKLLDAIDTMAGDVLGMTTGAYNPLTAMQSPSALTPAHFKASPSQFLSPTADQSLAGVNLVFSPVPDMLSPSSNSLSPEHPLSPSSPAYSPTSPGAHPSRRRCPPHAPAATTSPPPRRCPCRVLSGIQPRKPRVQPHVSGCAAAADSPPRMSLRCMHDRAAATPLTCVQATAPPAPGTAPLAPATAPPRRVRLASLSACMPCIHLRFAPGHVLVSPPAAPNACAPCIPMLIARTAGAAQHLHGGTRH